MRKHQERYVSRLVHAEKSFLLLEEFLVFMQNKLKELSREEVSNYKKLGTATGTWEVCLHMANKHVPNFIERVVGFHVEKGGTAEIVNNALAEAGLNKEKSINVTFYENNKNTKEESEVIFIPNVTNHKK